MGGPGAGGWGPITVSIQTPYIHGGVSDVFRMCGPRVMRKACHNGPGPGHSHGKYSALDKLWRCPTMAVAGGAAAGWGGIIFLLISAIRHRAAAAVCEAAEELRNAMHGGGGPGPLSQLPAQFLPWPMF